MLFLPDVVELPPDVALELSNSTASWIDLSGVRTLSPESARNLGGYPGRLMLGGLATLDAESARALVSGPLMELIIQGPDLDQQTLAALMRMRGEYPQLNIHLDLSDPKAAVLADFRGRALKVRGRGSIHASVAQALVRSQARWLHVEGIGQLDL
ncbi:MAG: hypothetical protein AAFS10_09515, partial [Myxococcota bacterium]